MTIEYESYGTKYQIWFEITSYQNNDNIAVMAMCIDPEYNFPEPYGTLTVNIDKLEPPLACIDTNNWRDAIELIEKYDLGTDTGQRIQSGYCTYPVYELNLNNIKKYDGKEEN